MTFVLYRVLSLLYGVRRVIMEDQVQIASVQKDHQGIKNTSVRSLNTHKRRPFGEDLKNITFIIESVKFPLPVVKMTLLLQTKLSSVGKRISRTKTY